MDVFWTAVVGAVFVLWWLACAVHQVLPPWWEPVIRYDRLRLLPQWHFFAPRPGRRDHHLLIRDVLDGRPGAWQKVDIGEAAPAWRWVWNPSRFRQKALVDLVNNLSKTRRDFVDRQLDVRSEELSLPYLGLLAWVVSQPAEHQPCRRQFAVVASQGHGDGRSLKVVYLSDHHAVTSVS